MNTLLKFITFPFLCLAVLCAHSLISSANAANLQNYLLNEVPLGYPWTSPLISDIGVHRNNLIPPYINEILSDLEHGSNQGALRRDNKVFADVSSQCINHSVIWIEALQALFNDTDALSNNFWALQMADAWGKLPEGILSGHTSAFGDFEECLAVRSNLKSSSQQVADNFKGKYCTTYLLPNLSSDFEPLNTSNSQNLVNGASMGLNALEEIPIPSTGVTLALLLPKLGTCFPSTCSDQDVGQLMTNLLGQIKLDELISPYVVYCTTDDSPKLNTGDIAMLTVISVILALCGLGTAVDLVLEPHSSKRNGYSQQALIAFSVYTNTKKWLNTKSGGGDNFGSMHGIRFLSTCWVILAHQFAQIIRMSWNMVEISQIHDVHWSLFSIFSGTVSVDTFFTMSGLLFSYNMLKLLNKSKGKINVPMMYLHRYLRLTPTYALLVGLVATFFAYLGNGPMWRSILQSSASCKNNWWHNLLYINNLIKYSDDPEHAMCHGETWYLANDMQFFIVSPLLIYPLFKWERIGMVILGLVTVASVATPWIVHATYEPTLMATLLLFGDVGSFNYVSYMKPWMRFGPYAVGLWAGFLLHKTANKKVKLSKLVVLAGWLLSTAAALSIIFGIVDWFDPETEIPKGLGAFYAGTHRFAWGLSISWIIFACTKGYGGPVNTLLSWKAFIPLGRLSFCAYLISLNLQEMFTARQLQPTTYDVYGTINTFFSQLVMTLLLSFICCITMESPFIALEKLVFQGPTKVSTPKPAEVNDTDGKQNV